MLRKILWFVFFLSVSATSCLDEPDCFALNNNFVQISFRRLLDNSADSIPRIGILIDGADTTTLSFGNQISFTGSSITVPVNFLQNETSGTFWQYLRKNNFRLVYESRAQFVSEDCGERFVLSNLRMEDHDFDSVRVVNSIPSGRITSNNPNIIVYRCPALNNVSMIFRQLYTDTASLGYAEEVFLRGVAADYNADIFYQDDVLGIVTLPLNEAANSTSFNLFLDEIRSVRFNYDVTPVNLVNVCGTQGVIDNLSVETNDFDIVRVIRDSLQDPPVTNVAFLRCPDTDIFRIDFQTSDGSGAEVYVKEITADYTSYVFYSDVSLSTVDLRLNPLSDSTIFTLDFQDSVRTIRVGYERVDETLHGACNRTRFSNIGVLSDFAQAPEVVSNSIQFPPETNVEIVAD